MTKRIVGVVVLLASITACGEQAGTPSASAPGAKAEMTEEQSGAYALGYQMGRQMHETDVQLEAGAFSDGVRAGLSGEKAPFSDEQLTQNANRAQEALAAQAQKADSDRREKALSESTAFLTENGKKPGVVTTASGLQYEIMTAGTGAKPLAASKVVTHYEGRLIDGTVFDSSIARGTPAEFPVNGVIQGWQEALQLMPKGSKWRLFVPAQLAYGERGAGNTIPPNAALVFEVELLDIKDAGAPAH